ncbi:hypothetical protein [Nostoc sp. PA-18-2419]|nr:hypothetical protein [Nostoc sp. PA-18-2419]
MFVIEISSLEDKSDRHLIYLSTITGDRTSFYNLGGAMSSTGYAYALITP